jgi:hypothetical protein
MEFNASLNIFNVKLDILQEEILHLNAQHVILDSRVRMVFVSLGYVLEANLNSMEKLVLWPLLTVKRDMQLVKLLTAVIFALLSMRRLMGFVSNHVLELHPNGTAPHVFLHLQDAQLVLKTTV